MELTELQPLSELDRCFKFFFRVSSLKRWRFGVEIVGCCGGYAQHRRSSLGWLSAKSIFFSSTLHWRSCTTNTRTTSKRAPPFTHAFTISFPFLYGLHFSVACLLVLAIFLLMLLLFSLKIIQEFIFIFLYGGRKNTLNQNKEFGLAHTFRIFCNFWLAALWPTSLRKKSFAGRKKKYAFPNWLHN